MTRSWIFLVALQSVSTTASAYCRTSTCGSEQSPDCAEASSCESGGAPLYWPAAQVTIGVENGSVLRGISAETARDILSPSMAAWTSVDCDGRPPSISVAPIEVVDPGPGTPAERDATSDAISALRFFDNVWPHDPSAIALTTVRYGVQSGKIAAADIETNSAGHRLTIVDVGGDFDLQSVLTHESGHFFGLAHVIEPAATMFASYTGGGNIDRRTLEANDRQGICTIYPPGRLDVLSGSGCGCRTAGTGDSLTPFGLATAAIMLSALRRRRAYPSATPKNRRGGP
jgi:MYXO-CTERM domain-containing protein